MRLSLPLAFVLLAATSLSAQEGFDKIKVGDRVVATLKNKSNFSGLVVLPPMPREQRPADPVQFVYATATQLSIDVSYEYPSLGKGATVTLDRSTLQSVRVLTQYSPEEKARIEAAIQREALRLKAEEEERQARERARMEEIARAFSAAAATEDQEAAGADKAASRQAAIDLYERYPEPDWGRHRLDEISQKTFTKVPVTSDERDFLNNFELWLKGKSYKEKGTEEEKKPEEAPTEENPESAPAPATPQ